MSLTTYPLTVELYNQSGEPVSNAVVIAQLSRSDFSENEGAVVRERVEKTTNNSGIAVFNLWPNSLGLFDTKYRIYAVDVNTGVRLIDCKVAMPEKAVNLRDLISQAAAPPNPYPNSWLHPLGGIVASGKIYPNQKVF